MITVVDSETNIHADDATLGMPSRSVVDANTGRERSNTPQMKPNAIEDASMSNDGSAGHGDSDGDDGGLPFHNLCLIGRDKEIQLLKRTFLTTCTQARALAAGSDASSLGHDGSSSNRSGEFRRSAASHDGDAAVRMELRDHDAQPIMSSSSKRSLVLISGHSGSGKTALAMQVKRFASAQGNGTHDNNRQHRPFHGFFVSGKCEISKMNAEQPYAGIKSALADLCNQILCLPRDEHDLDHAVEITVPLMKSVGESTSSETATGSTAATSSSSNSSSSMGEADTDADGDVGTPQKRMPHQTSSTTTPEYSSASDTAAGGGNHDDGDDHRRLSILRKLLKRGLTRSEIQVLSNVIPELPQAVYGKEYINLVVGNGLQGNTEGKGASDEASVMSGSTMTMPYKQSKARPWNERIGYRAHGDRLKFALRKLIQIICNYCPLIFVIDDLQWADKASLDILKSWMLDSKNSSLMIIGCYRSNLLEENDVLKTTLTSLDESKRERALRIVKLPIQDLEVHHINELLCRLLAVPTDGHALNDHSANGADNADDVDDADDIDDADEMNGRSKVVKELADVVHQKTAGNPFFVQRFLHSLVDEGLLKYNGAKQPSPPSLSASAASNTKNGFSWAWSWNDTDIRSKSPSTSNIIDLMKDKLQQVQNARQILPIAACLGASFSHSTICIVMRGLSIHSAHSAFVRKLFGINRFVSNNDIDEMLHTCEQEGLVEMSMGFKRASSHPPTTSDKLPSRTLSGIKGHKKRKKTKSSTIYNFSHDKVQEAALAMLDQEQLSELKYRVGEILLFGLPDDELTERIFMVANLVNTRFDLIPDTNKSERGKRVMMLNFDAGSKAVGCSSFHLASRYFRNAINLLPNGHWETMQEETLEIYSAAAECAYVTSNLDRARRYCNEIIESKCDILDKVDAYHTLIDAGVAELRNDGNESTALRLCLDVLSQLGCQLPKPGIRRTLSTIFGLLKLKRTVHTLTTESIDDLPLMTNRKEDAIMQMLQKLIIVAYFADAKSIPCISLASMKRTIKHGVSEHSAMAFVYLGLTMGAFMGDFHAREVFGQAAFDILERVNEPASAATAVFQCWALVRHWKRPIEQLKEPLMEAYHMGMSVGNVYAGSWSIAIYSLVNIIIGTPLSKIDADCATYSKVLLDFDQNAQYAFFATMWQVVLNLRGASKHRILLIGDAFDERSDLNDGDSTINAVHKRSVQMAKLQLCVYFEDYGQGASLAIGLVDHVMRDFPGSPSLPPALFRMALCCRAASHSKTASRKYKKIAVRCVKDLKAWSKQGHPNGHHYIMILDAERHFLRGNHDFATKMYLKAIESSAARGFIQDQALANERLGDCGMKCGRREDARSRYEESERLYTLWGATRKVEDLQLKIQGIFG